MGHGNEGAYGIMEAVRWWKGSPRCQVQATEMWEDCASLLNPATLQQDKEKKKKESILDLSKYIDKTIRVKFQGGREASGILKGFDPLLNLVLDGTIEYMRDPDDQYKLTEDTRQLGLVVCRGTSVVLICPQDGMEAIPNPFVQQQDA
ncbi:U6 snRNA-associated Sm-like protein LSm7 isoform X1 [Microtus pennsylvanicus]|uniref:U6 snRNA-associated Sm-like protein LSm7 isoform X1 n=1 Tax=Microtus pennsylvanicus TaxID=10058 RepID=UPI003F6C053B